jgi:SAM-dependent methyltransferase
MATVPPRCDWPGYIVRDFSFAGFPRGARVLDIGFGGGDQMRELLARGCRAIGVEFDAALARAGRAAGLTICRAAAEALPFASGAFDGVVCKVVIPYTDEARAVAEIARVLRPGGVARVSFHGLGYSLRYFLTDRDWKRRLYAARVMANTLLYTLMGRRLPGFWGDTIYQSERRLRRYYQRTGLEITPTPAPRFVGAPVFIYHALRKRA